MIAINGEVDTDDKISYDSIKQQMGLEKLICGFPTIKTGAPCKCRIDSSNEDEINLQIGLLSRMTQASEGFETELEKLAVLVHCQYHAYKRYKAQRINSWKKIFPTATNFSPQEDEQIRELFNNVSATCSGTTVQGKPCRMKLGGQTVQHARRTISELTNSEIYLDEGNRVYALEALAIYMFCSHHTRQGEDKLLSWKLSISTICRSAQKTESARDDKPTVESQILRARREGTPPAECWPNVLDDSRFITEIKPDRPTCKEDAYELIKQTLLLSLDSTDQRDGQVYVYQVDGNEDFVKIGYTSRRMTERSEEWTLACNRASTLVYPSPEDLSLRIPYAKRVEALCHAELQYMNEIVDCNACIVNHIEWFRTSVAEAIAVVRKWIAWIKMEPYEQSFRSKNTANTKNSKIDWRLSDDMARRTKNMDAFMQMLSKLPVSELKE